MSPPSRGSQSGKRGYGRHCTSKQIKIYTSELWSGLIREGPREAEKLGWSTKASLILKAQSREEMGPGRKGAHGSEEVRWERQGQVIQAFLAMAP